MGYIEDPAMIRVDFFKESGKWYTTEAVKWTGDWKKEDQSIHAAFAQSLRNHFKEKPLRLSDMDAICLHPYHELEHPLCIKKGGWNSYED